MSIIPSSGGGSLPSSKGTRDSTAPNLKRKRLAEWEKEKNLDKEILVTESKVDSNKDTPTKTTTYNPSLVTDLSYVQKSQDDIGESSRSQQKRRIKGGIKAWQELARTFLRNDNTELDNTQQEEKVFSTYDKQKEEIRETRLKKLEEKLNNAQSVNVMLEDIIGTDWHINIIKTIKNIQEKQRLHNIYTEKHSKNFENNEKKVDAITLLAKNFLSLKDWCHYSGATRHILSDVRQNKDKLTTSMALRLTIGYFIRRQYILNNKIDVLKLNTKGWTKLKENDPIVNYDEIKCNLSDFLNKIPIVLETVCPILFQGHLKKKPFKQEKIAKKTKQVIKTIKEYAKDIESFDKSKSMVTLKDMFDIINDFTRFLFSAYNKK